MCTYTVPVVSGYDHVHVHVLHVQYTCTYTVPVVSGYDHVHVLHYL